MLSARNQLKGTIETIKEGAVNAIVILKTQANETITAGISVDAVRELELTSGKEAYAVIKATEVMIGIGDMKLSARNQLSGEIISVKEGAVNAAVTLKTDGGSLITANISIAAVKELELSAGVKAKAVIKASSVMIGI